MFERIEVPTPFQIGRVNTFVAGRTLVDPGPDSEKAWNTLSDGLAGIGLEPADVEQVLITHAHLDHFGLAERFRDLGADIVAHPEAEEVMVDFPARLEYEQSYFAPFFERCGVDPEITETVVTLPEPFLSYACNVETDREVVDGETIEIDGTRCDVIGLGGHGPGEIAFAFDDGDERHAIVGDTVLEDITPNPMLLPPQSEGGERPRQLLEQNESLERLRSASYDRFLPGHRAEIPDPNRRLDEILEANESRTATVQELVEGPTQPVDVMEELFGDLPLTEIFAGMSEAVGHLDLLVERDELTVESTDDELVYSPRE